MQQIGEWLAKLGLAEYASCFAENRIDFSVLPDLTDQDLKDLGVVLGDRRKILRAIASNPLRQQLQSLQLRRRRLLDLRTLPSGGRLLCSSQTSSALRPSLRAWTPKTSVRSLRPTRRALRRPCNISVGSLRSTWGTAF